LAGLPKAGVVLDIVIFCVDHDTLTVGRQLYLAHSWPESPIQLDAQLFVARLYIRLSARLQQLLHLPLTLTAIEPKLKSSIILDPPT